ncbi:MAG: hypothetical protein N2654_06070 [Deltaproteobacteria bacterium]|nr:hypothetical protein [Deltaproteobacteria bacterium]
MSRKILVLSDNYPTDKETDQVWLPINIPTVQILQRDIAQIRTTDDLVRKIKGDIGLLLLSLKLDKIQSHLKHTGKYKGLTLEKEDLEKFLQLIKSYQYFDPKELRDTQISTIKIVGVLINILERAKALQSLSALRPILPTLYFSFFTPSWFERTLKKSSGNFDEFLFRTIDCGPLRPQQVEEFFSYACGATTLLDDLTVNKTWLTLSACSEPEIFDLTASNVMFYIQQAKQLCPTFDEQAFEDCLEQWGQKWASYIPKKFVRYVSLDEITRVSKAKKGDRLLDKYAYLTKVFQLDHDIFQLFFSEIQNGEPSLEALKILFDDLIPKAGYNLGIVFLANENKKVLVPKLKFGNSRNYAIPAVLFESTKPGEEQIVETYMSRKLSKIEAGELFGISGSFFIVPFYYPNHSGVLVIGTEPEDPKTITIEAIKSAQNFSILLGLALGYETQAV